MRALFSTKRFDVFHVHCERNPKKWQGRDVYIALHHTEDVPAPVCVVTVWAIERLGNYVEWVEVCDRDRRQGIATEVIEGLESAIGALRMEGATEAGEALVASLYRDEQVT